MENLLLQDDLNALLCELSENTTTAVSKKEISGMEGLLSQDDLNALLGGLPESTTAVSKKEISGMEDLLSQDDLNALLGGLPESTIKVSQQMTASDMPAERESGGESMSQEEIDEMLRQFDRDI
jgi:hypothetical protein